MTNGKRPSTYQCLELHSKPRATIVLFETQLPLTPDAPTVYRYSTSRGTVFEEHVTPSGVHTWYKERK
jgi:hypothetical protein